MESSNYLFQAFIYLAAAVVSVPIAKRLGLGSVLGYLLAGVIIGPHVFGFIGDARGDVMTRSGFEYILEKHVRTASAKQASLAQKRVSPHSLRHSCGMHTLHATGDIRKVALWLGHASLQSTEVYLRADPTEKLEAMASLVPPTLRRGQFRPPDKLLAMLRPKQ